MPRILVFALLFFLFAFSATAESLSILVNAGNPVMNLSDQDLAAYFLKTRTAWPESRTVHPVEIYGNNPAKLFFRRAVLKKDEPAWSDYWKKSRNDPSRLPPLEVASFDALLTFVAFDAGAIAYVSTAALKGRNLQGVRVVRTVE